MNEDLKLKEYQEPTDEEIRRAEKADEERRIKEHHEEEEKMKTPEGLAEVEEKRKREWEDYQRIIRWQREEEARREAEYTALQALIKELEDKAALVSSNIDGDMQRMEGIIHGLEGKLFWRNWVFKADSLGDIAALSIAQLIFEKHNDKVKEAQGAVADIKARHETKDNLSEVSKDLGALRTWRWVLEKESNAVDKDLVDLRGLLEDHGAKEDKQ